MEDENVSHGPMPTEVVRQDGVGRRRVSHVIVKIYIADDAP